MIAVPDENAVWEALREVDDPEAGMNIVELGLVYTVTATEGRVEQGSVIHTFMLVIRHRYLSPVAFCGGCSYKAGHGRCCGR